METVIILGLMVILTGGYLRFHRARLYAPLVSRELTRADDSAPFDGHHSRSGDCLLIAGGETVVESG
jgi:hypothetical protein